MALPPACLSARIVTAVLCAFGLVAAAYGQDADPLKIPDVQLEPLSWTALDGWAADDHVAAFSAFMKSCTPFLAGKEPREGRPIHTALWQVCRRAGPPRPPPPGGGAALFGG